MPSPPAGTSEDWLTVNSARSATTTSDVATQSDFRSRPPQAAIVGLSGPSGRSAFLFGVGCRAGRGPRPERGPGAGPPPCRAAAEQRASDLRQVAGHARRSDEAPATDRAAGRARIAGLR